MLGYFLTHKMYKNCINTYQSNTKHANLIPGHIVLYVCYSTGINRLGLEQCWFLPDNSYMKTVSHIILDTFILIYIDLFYF